MDYSPETLLKARRRAAQSISWLSADARKLPFPERTFDGILCFGVAQALSETLPVVVEAARVLKPGGEFWVDSLNGACLTGAFSTLVRYLKQAPARLRYERVRHVTRALRAAGFEPLELFWLPIAPTEWRALQPLLESIATPKIMPRVPLLSSVLSHSFIVRARR